MGVDYLFFISRQFFFSFFFLFNLKVGPTLDLCAGHLDGFSDLSVSHDIFSPSTNYLRMIEGMIVPQSGYRGIRLR